MIGEVFILSRNIQRQKQNIGMKINVQIITSKIFDWYRD